MHLVRDGEINMKKKRLLGMFDIFSLGFGGAVGSGIFVMIGIGIGYTGKSISLVFIVCSILSLLAYMYNVVISSMFAFKGGNYSQTGLLLNLTMTGVNATFTLIHGIFFTIFSMGITKYITSVIPAAGAYSKIIASGILIIFYAASIRGSKSIAVLQNVMTVILVGSILMFIVVGLFKVQPGYFSEDFFSGGASGFFGAVAFMSFACQGSTIAPVAMASVTKKPTKTIPLTILLITAALALLYSLVGVVASGVLPIEEVAGQNLSQVAERIFPTFLYSIFILGGAVFALATTMLCGIAVIRYPIEQIAEDGWIPAVFKKKTTAGYPWVIALFYFTISLVPIFLGFSFEALVSLIIIPNMLICAYCNLACIKLPKRFPVQWSRSILRMPVPVLAVVMTASAAVDLLIAAILFTSLGVLEMVLSVCLIVICIGLAVYRIKARYVNLEAIEAYKKSILDEAETSTIL